MLTNARVTAVLGPTNTGKTHYAIDRMLGHRSGVIGLPLRLLAREVYDRIVAARGPSVVALVTGEERIVGERTQYWVCTVEAMPLDIGADFVAVDEIQLCADPGRGHVFTDRLLRARGLVETLFLGSEAMRGAIAALVPKVTFLKRERFSTLTYTGSKKISRMPARSAIVGFSVDNVYAIAELIRRQKGGCAVVMGALSPRTRNAQVAMYQNGEVDYLVATDAIGMGLNLDIRHVAFSATAKFDGRRMRPLFPHEMGQIAGRAGRHLTPGTFGVTGEAGPLDDDLVEALENHRFAPVRRLSWRNEALDFGSIARLVDSLEAPTTNEWLTRAREADDLVALKTLSDMPEIAARLSGPQAVRLLWEVACVPDFRGVSEAEHATLLARIFGYLSAGQVPSDWMAQAVARIDKTEGDIDTLSKRLAFVRTYTYVAQRKGWLAEESHWRDATRAVEDRLSDALHAALTKAFVDRRTSVLMRRLKQKESLVADVNDKGEVSVEGEFVGRLEGFRFRQDASGSPDEARTLRQAAVQALRPEFHLRSDKFYNAPDTEVDFTAQGGLMWGTNAVGKLVKGPDILHPVVEPFVDEDAGPEVAEKVRRRLQHFIDRKVAALFEPLTTMQKDEGMQGLARGFAFRLVEGLGILPRDVVAEDAKALDQEARGALRKHGVRFGQFTIFQPLLLKPKATALRLVLWSLANGVEDMPESPPPGLVTIPNLAAVPRGHYTLAGYHPAGARAIRIDMLERLADLLRAKDSRAGFEATPDMLSITGMTLEQFVGLMEGLSYRGVRAERAKVKAEAVVVVTPAAAEDATVADVAEEVQAETVPAPETAAGTVAVIAAETAAVAVPETAAETVVEVPEETPVPEMSAPEIPAPEIPAPEIPAPEMPAPEMEVFYTFTWAPRARAERNANRPARPAGAEGASERPRGPRPPRQGQRPPPDRREAGADPAVAAADGATPPESPADPRPEAPRPDTPRGDRPRHKHGSKPQGERQDSNPGVRPPREGQGERPERGGDRGDRKGGGAKPAYPKPAHPKPAYPKDDRPKTYEARPPRVEKPIDPDNPFAVLAALKGRV